VLSDPRAVTSTPASARTLGEIKSDLLRVACESCFRRVEIRRDDAIAKFGADARWRHVASVCSTMAARSDRRLEEHGCWPDFRS
jgi:hypothetical protein